MNRPFLTYCVILLSFLNLNAQENYPSGARSLALSHSFVSISDTWSTFHNQATLAQINKISAGFFYESRFNIDELSLASGSLVLPTKRGTFGLSFFQFGEGTYKENKLGIAFAKQLSNKFYAGVQLDYYSLRLPENNNRFGFATFEAGAVYSPSEKLFLGFHIFNPISNGLNLPEEKQKMPVIYRLGGHYLFDDTILLSVETQKDSGKPSLLKTGIEFSPVNNLALRFGVSGKPLNYTTGFGYVLGRISTDFAFSYHGNLGITPSVSIQFNL